MSESSGAYVTDGEALARVEGAEAYLRQLGGQQPVLTMWWLEAVMEALRAKLADRGIR